MKVKTVPSKCLYQEGLRLDSKPYMSGALESRAILEALEYTEPLKSFTKGHNGGIYNGPKFSRTWVEDPEYGVPFLGSTTMLMADLSNLPLIRKKDAVSPKLSYLELREGTTLISCSGSIGRTVFVREDMEGIWSSQHIMKVVPDQRKILPGYLYAYLSSSFGVPLVVSGTYGAIIQHIEPHHIEDLPVPRPGKEIEEKIHFSVQKASELRAEASFSKQKMGDKTQKLLGLQPMKSDNVTQFGITNVQSMDLNLRLDALYHCPAAIEAESLISSSPHDVKKLVEVVNYYFKPPLFKRLWVDSPEYGRQFVSGIDAYRYQAEEVRYVSRKTPNFDQFILKKGWLVFQAAGQIYGLFGQPLYVHGWLENIFCADDIYRIVPHNEHDGAYLYAFFRTQHGQALLKRQACGNSIPRVWDPHMRRINVVWPDEDLRHEIAKEVIEIHEKIEKARILENQAIQMTNEAITELGQQ